MKKNDKLELNIIDMTKEGLGLAKLDGQVFFVKDAIIGDKVLAIVTKITNSIVYAKTIDVIEKSRYRVEPKCNIANACGGCQLLCLDYSEQLKLKVNNVINCLTKISHFNIVLDDNAISDGSINLNNSEKNDNVHYLGILHSENPYNFRNKMQIPFSMRNGKIVYGFYAGRTHHIVEFNKCEVGFIGIEKVLDRVKSGLEKYSISIYDENTNRGIFREVMLRMGNFTNEVSITYIVNDLNFKKNLDLYKKLDEYVRNDFKVIVTSTLNINTANNNVLFGNENIIIYGKGYIEDRIGEIKYYISPESFYQINMEMTKKLYDTVVEFADFNGKENVLDLYCGIGTISLYIAKHVKRVYGVEIVERAVENARENASLNDISNIEFKCADLGDKNIMNNDEFYDTIIVDPPRKGLDKNTIDFIKGSNTDKIIYVSCDPATLSRDLSIICNDNKYKLVKIKNVDMFPHTMHVETVALVVRV